MTMHDHANEQLRTPQGISRNARIGLVFVGFAVIAGALLFTEHRAHVLGLLIWLPVLACPLMHLFMHGGHHHGHHHGNDAQRRTP